GHPRLPEGPLLPAAPSIPTHRLLGANPTRQTCAGNDERTPTLRPRPLDRPHPPHHRRRHAVRLDLDRTMAVGPHRSLPPPRRPRRRRLLHQGRQGTAVTRRPPRVCTRCRQTVPAGQPCPTYAPQLDREADARRGSAHARGYNRLHRGRFRVAVLRRDPVCTCNTACRESGVVVHEPGDCDQVSTVADHWPLTKKEL